MVLNCFPQSHFSDSLRKVALHPVVAPKIDISKTHNVLLKFQMRRAYHSETSVMDRYLNSMTQKDVVTIFNNDKQHYF